MSDSHPIRSLAGGLVFMILLGVASVAQAQAQAQATDPASRLSDRDASILTRGLYTEDQMTWGGITGTLIGFGSGHAIQDRWRETGWIYTAGESASVVALIGGTVGCARRNDNDSFGDIFDTTDCFLAVSLVSTATFAAFRVVEAFDVWISPRRHNARFRELEARRARRAVRIAPYVAPYVAPGEAGGAAFGLALRF
ncbi:MAG: hypothetical protein AAGC67_04000 [Myxococcota bacterium]